SRRFDSDPGRATLRLRAILGDLGPLLARAQEGPMTGAARFALVAAAVMVTGCAGGPRAEAPPPPPAQTVRAGGLALTAVADQWRAFPPDLDRYYLAIETTIENGREAPVELRYEDFA